MTNENEILRRLREKVGLSMTRSSDFDALAQAIWDKTNQNLGVNTLKRLFGFKTKRVVPRGSTMDIIARYLGCNDYESLIKEIGEDADISDSLSMDFVVVRDLEKDTQLRLAYEPSRVFVLTYLGDLQFIVDDVVGSRNIQKGDILTISQMVVGHSLVFTHVVRDGIDHGAYEAARFRGLKSVDIIH